jgi:hypothetical protein
MPEQQQPETKQVMVLIGPYRDHRLTMSAADAESAINNHWAVDPFPPPEPPAARADRDPGVYQSADEKTHPPLSDDERKTALEAAHAWAQAQWDLAQATAKPKEGEARAKQPRHDEAQTKR